jgi:hypothetical protein
MCFLGITGTITKSGRANPKEKYGLGRKKKD